MKSINLNSIKFSDNQIIIGPSYLKKNVIDFTSLKYNIKYIDYAELRGKYLYEYKDSALVYLDKKYNYIPEIGKIILNNLYEVDTSKVYKSSKLNELVKIKKDLIENNHIVFNDSIKVFLESKDIIIFKDNVNSIINKIFLELEKKNSVSYYELETKVKEGIDIYEFNTLEEELLFVANKISDLIKEGITLDKIKINTLDSVYKAPINKIFNYYNIPFNINTNNSLYKIPSIKKLLSSINDDTLTVDVNNILTTLNMKDKLKYKIIEIFNKYTDFEYVREYKEELIYDLKNTNITFDEFNNAVKEINYKNYLPKDDEYIFILGFNQDKIPKIHKDDKYLLDIELEELDSDTSLIKNKLETNTLFDFINNTKNIYLSYKLTSNFQNFTMSNYINELKESMKVNIIKEVYDYRNELINKIMLGDRLDNFIKYNARSEDLENLYSSYTDLEYNSYDNSYNKIDYSIIKKRLDNKINLSYSNTNTFFKCKFRFMLENIFKLSTYEETISQKIGNLFHEVLYRTYKDNVKDYDKIIDDVIHEMYINPSKKELFYLEKYRKAMKKLISVINDNLEKTDYDNSYFEHWFSINKENDLEVKIVGKIDRIMTFKDENNTYTIVIDYKTGSLHGDFNKVIYGLDMQLLYYLYLIKNTKVIENPVFTGMYLQSIMSEVLSSEKNKTYDELVTKNMKLDGYTTDKVDRLYHIDKEYMDSSYIKGIKVKQSGEFYAYSKVLDDEKINKLIDIVGENIESVIKCINESSFEINPKKLGNTNVGCEYCSFRDICYMNNNNIVELKEYKDLEFLGGEEDDTN